MPSSPLLTPGGTYPLAGRPVARIGYGAMQLGAVGARPRPELAPSLAVLRRATQLGVTHLDTADFYDDGHVNALIRGALGPQLPELTIVTKVGAAHAGHTLVSAQKPHELRASVEANLRQLGVERVDVVNLRRVDRAPGIVAEGDQLVDLDSQLAELTAMRDEGKLGAIGLSHVSAEQLRQALPAGPVCVQNAYSLLSREDEELLAVAAEHDVAWVPYFPLGSAFAHFPSVTDDATVIAIARRLGATPAQVGLAWLLQHASNVMVIPGTTSVAHLEENVAAGEVVLDDEAVAALDAIGG
jgi:pyridoxine 4-dehydrogenase